MYKNMLETERQQKAIRRVLFAYWIHKATNTHSKYVMLIAFFIATMVTQMCLNITFICRLPLLLVYSPDNIKRRRGFE
jgi:hypothetical protein